MLNRQRKRLLLERLARDGQLQTGPLALELGLSEDTLRRDLRELAAEGQLQRVHGGALPISRALADFAGRERIEEGGKAAIGRAAAARVQNGQVVFLDGGTTAVQVARHLSRALEATVVTHSPSVALELVSHPHVEVVLLGGVLYKHSVVALGAATLEALGQVHADVYFMGVTGIHPQLGLTTGHLEEAHVKRALSAQAAETWVLASSEKLGAASPYVVLPCSSVTGLIVSAEVSDAALEPFVQLGLGVVKG